MATKWYEYAEKKLKKKEKFEKNFEGRLDGNYGYLFITNMRLLFIKQEGFLRKSYEMILDLPQKNVESLECTGKYQMDIVESGGNRHRFESDIVASRIEKIIKEVFMAD